MLAGLIGCVAVWKGRADAVGVGAIEKDEMLVGLRDVDEHASEELEWVDQSIVVEVVPVARFIHEQVGGLVEAQPRQVDGCSHEIARKLVHAFGVCGIDGGVIVHAETKVIPTMPPEYKHSK